MRAVMFRQTPEWLRENIDEFSRLIGDSKESVKLIFLYAVLGGERLTREEFHAIIRRRINMSILYEPGSVMDQIVREKDLEIQEIRQQSEENRRPAEKNKQKAEETERLALSLQQAVEERINSGMSEEEVSKVIGLSPERISELRNSGTADTGN